MRGHSLRRREESIFLFDFIKKLNFYDDIGVEVERWRSCVQRRIDWDFCVVLG